MILELVFHYVQFNTINIYSLFRMYLFTFIFSMIITSLISKKSFHSVTFIIITLLCAYSFVELIFKNKMGDFYSFNTVSDGATRIAQYALIFVQSAPSSYYLCFLPIIVYIFLAKFVELKSKISFFNFLTTIISIFMLVICFNWGSGYELLSDEYKYYSNKSILVDRLGITHFLARDLASFFYTSEDNFVIEESIEDDADITNTSRDIDDTYWESIIKNETNQNLQAIDKYLSSKNITDTNEHTGRFEDYNFVYFMVEALDYLAIDPELTPTLYKMYKDGDTFYNHYSPLYSCATGESEFVSYTSLFPYLNLCTPNYVYEHKFYEALPFLFKNKGYTTFALHNWRDEFYARNELLPNLGFDYYVDIDDIWKDTSIVHNTGWLSDTMLVQQAIEEIAKTDGKFFCDIITSAMHFPYNESSYWGDYYLNDVRKVHPEWSIDYQRYMSKSMDFDNSLKVLMDYLEANDLADNTVICIYADHRPYWLNYDLVVSYTKELNDRNSDYGIYRSPFIIYCPDEIGEVNYNYCSTLDHVPTIANLFNLNYDPRLYMGQDIYSGDNVVIFTDGNWLNKDGIYYAINDQFVTNDGSEYDDMDVYRIKKQTNNIIKISEKIFDENYFEQRKNICNVTHN